MPLNERDAKLVQWLNEARAKEIELERVLSAHISLTTKQSYKRRLQQHLTETRDHERKVSARIRALGGSADGGGVTGLVAEAAGIGVAAVKAPVDALRAVLTEQAETHVRNAQDELREEHVEIALYARIGAFAEEVGDKETARMATSIRRDEERMAKFLEAELVRLVKDVVRAEVPREQRRIAPRPTRRRAGSRSTGGSRSRTGSRSGAGSRSSAGSRTGGSSRRATATASR